MDNLNGETRIEALQLLSWKKKEFIHNEVYYLSIKKPDCEGLHLN
jgi:hypothetical protein